MSKDGGVRRCVKQLLLTEPARLARVDETAIQAIRSQCYDPGVDPSGSIKTIRSDFLNTIRALRDLDMLADSVAKHVRCTPPKVQAGSLYKFNKILCQRFRDDPSDELIDAGEQKVIRQELGMSLQNFADSLSASSESIDVLHENGSILSKLEIDLKKIRRKKGISRTVRKQLIDARLGQGQFRTALLERWGEACAVTKCALSEILRASHMQGWRDSNDEERLDPENGLLLVAHLDALFDRHLISFKDDGDMLVSPRIKVDDRQLLGIPQRLRKTLSDEERRFLAVHRA
jgi:hypothetical protein